MVSGELQDHLSSGFSIDATHSSGCGRMLNDSRKPNCKVVVEQKEEGDDLKLAIYTLKAICKGSELRFDYNDRNAFWRRVSTDSTVYAEIFVVFQFLQYFTVSKEPRKL